MSCCLKQACYIFRVHGYRTKLFQIRSVGAVSPSRAYSSTDEERMMPFVEYRKLRRSIKLRSRLAGLPMAFVGVTLSSAINVHFQPQMLEFQNPEVELTPILWVPLYGKCYNNYRSAVILSQYISIWHCLLYSWKSALRFLIVLGTVEIIAAMYISDTFCK